MVVLPTVAQEMMGIRVTAGADHVVHPAAELVESVPVQGVADDRGHRTVGGKRGPHAIAGAQVGAVKRAGLSRIEPLPEVIGIPEVEVTHLGALDRSDAKEPAGRNVETLGLARRNEHLVDLGRSRAPGPVGVERHGREGLGRVTDHRRDRAALVRIEGRFALRLKGLHRVAPIRRSAARRVGGREWRG